MAEKTVTNFLPLLILAISCLCFAQGLDISLPDRRTVHRFDIDSSVKVSEQARSAHSLKKRDIRHVRAADGICQTQEQTFLEKLSSSGGDAGKFNHSFQFGNESKYSMALTWAGKNNGHILVVVTEEVFMLAKPSNVYLSTDDGRHFVDINSKIDNAVIRKDNGLQKHPLLPETVYLIAHTQTSHSDLYITSDGGNTFKQIQLPFLMTGVFTFHPKKPDFILAEDMMSSTLWRSADGGVSWKKVLSHVLSFRWTTYDQDDSGTIYAISNDEVSMTMMGMVNNIANNKLQKSRDLGDSWDTIRLETVTFGMQGRFLYCSRISPEDPDSRFMEVSTDGGKTWNEAQLPTITSDRFYAILDMTEGLIFMHVDNPRDTGHGTLFTSDATGLIFSESLVKHLYPNYLEVTDFYKVQSMRGVYMASQMEDDNSIHTMITFDRGGEWRPVKRPDGVPCKDESKACFLQIHNSYSISQGIRVQPPLSVGNATGIIMVHGHIADSLQKTPPDVFVTSDGGYSWIKALDGPHHYQIADQGGLLVAVPSDTPNPKVVKFSTDEGRCWHTYTFTNEDVVFTGLLTEPGNQAMSVALWGYGGTDRKWRSTVIDFMQVIDRQCDLDDYETWMAHGDTNADPQFNGCLLGVRESFQRLKKDSWCHNGHASEISNPTQQYCPCTKSDYECDYGYFRPGQSEICIRDPDFKGAELDICLRGHEEKLVTEGYHKVPGDLCVGGFTPPADKLIELDERCNEGDKSEVIEEVLPNRPDLQDEYVKKKHRQSAIIIVCVLVAVLLGILAMAIMIRRYSLLKNVRVQYRYSVLNTGEGDYDYDNKLDAVVAGQTSIYEDSSDEDLPPVQVGSNRNRRPPHQTPTLSVTQEMSNGSIKQNGYFDPFQNAKKSPSTSAPATSSQPSSQSPTQPKVHSYHDDSDDDLLE